MKLVTFGSPSGVHRTTGICLRVHREGIKSAKHEITTDGAPQVDLNWVRRFWWVLMFCEVLRKETSFRNMPGSG